MMQGALLRVAPVALVSAAVVETVTLSDAPLEASAVVAPVVALPAAVDGQDIKAIVASEVRSYIQQRASGEIRAHLAKETNRQVDNARDGVGAMVKQEIELQVKEQVAAILREDAALQDLMDKHLIAVERGVDEKARIVLDRIADEERYQFVNDALRRSLERKVDTKIGTSVLAIACSNVVLLGAMALFLVNRR